MAVTIEKIIEIKPDQVGNMHPFPVASGETIYGGTFAVVDNDGYLRNLSSTYVYEARLVVIVADESDNADGPAATTSAGGMSGSLEQGTDPAGDKTIRHCYVDGTFLATFTAIAQNDLGKTVYASDNYTVDETQDAAVKIGSLRTYLSATSGWFALNAFSQHDGLIKAKFALIAGTTTTGGDVISWINPTLENIIVENVIIDATTAASGAANIDVGVAADGTTSSNTLIDGADIGTAAIVASCHNAAGTSGGADRKMTSTQYITGTPSATAAGLVGTCTVLYRYSE